VSHDTSTSVGTDRSAASARGPVAPDATTLHALASKRYVVGVDVV